jgi:hypothetical protein
MQQMKPINAPLRISDLVPGELYYSPLGKLCMLMRPTGNGISNTCLVFSYMTKNRKASADEGFAINACNAVAISKLRKAEPGGPMTIPVYIRARGM